MHIDRSAFTPDGSNPDVPVPCSLTRSVPTEFMVNLLRDLLATNGKVLEIGTGSGYQTAVLAKSCKEVVSVEVHPDPAVGEKLPANVTLVSADGCTYDSGEEFDGVLITFGASEIVEPWVKQLRVGGRLVIPLALRDSYLSRICVYERVADGLRLLEIPAYAPFLKQVN